MQLSWRRLLFSLLCFSVLASPLSAQKKTILTAIEPPPGYVRLPVEAGTFAAALRDLELTGQTELMAGDGKTLLCDENMVAVTVVTPFNNEKDDGIDGILKLWGEHLWKTRRGQISYPLNNGQIASWKDWRDGLRPRPGGGRFVFTQITTPDGSYGSYQQFLSFVSGEMGALALRRESEIIVEDSASVGDLIVALTKDNVSRVGIILDACKGPMSERLYLLGTSGTPSTNLYIARPFAPVQGVEEWFTLEGARWEIGQGIKTDLRRVTLK